MKSDRRDATRFDTGPEMKITALAPWFGSKRTLAPEIVRELGRHTKYDEPFHGTPCGGTREEAVDEVGRLRSVEDPPAGAHGRPNVEVGVAADTRGGEQDG